MGQRLGIPIPPKGGVGEVVVDNARVLEELVLEIRVERELQKAARFLGTALRDENRFEVPGAGEMLGELQRLGDVEGALGQLARAARDSPRRNVSRRGG